MHRAFCSFNDDEYEALEAKAKKLGMSTSKLIEYATTLFLDMPRSETPNVKEIRKKIEKYLIIYPAQCSGKKYCCRAIGTPYGQTCYSHFLSPPVKFLFFIYAN